MSRGCAPLGVATPGRCQIGGSSRPAQPPLGAGWVGPRYYLGLGLHFLGGFAAVLVVVDFRPAGGRQLVVVGGGAPGAGWQIQMLFRAPAHPAVLRSLFRLLDWNKRQLERAYGTPRTLAHIPYPHNSRARRLLDARRISTPVSRLDSIHVLGHIHVLIICRGTSYFRGPTLRNNFRGGKTPQIRISLTNLTPPTLNFSDPSSLNRNLLWPAPGTVKLDDSISYSYLSIFGVGGDVLSSPVGAVTYYMTQITVYWTNLYKEPPTIIGSSRYNCFHSCLNRNCSIRIIRYEIVLH